MLNRYVHKTRRKTLGTYTLASVENFHQVAEKAISKVNETLRHKSRDQRISIRNMRQTDATLASMLRVRKTCSARTFGVK